MEINILPQYITNETISIPSMFNIDGIDMTNDIIEYVKSAIEYCLDYPYEDFEDYLLNLFEENEIDISPFEKELHDIIIQIINLDKKITKETCNKIHEKYLTNGEFEYYAYYSIYSNFTPCWYFLENYKELNINEFVIKKIRYNKKLDFNDKDYIFVDEYGVLLTTYYGEIGEYED